MIYQNVCKGIFIKRPNRFIAHVLIHDKEEICHVKNTGRCKELLVPGCTVYLEDCRLHTNRKTGYDVIAVEKKLPDGKSLLINMDSQAPNKVVYEWIQKGNLFPSNANLKTEVTYHNSHFDLFASYNNTKAFIEIKGVTLEENGIVRFPDAPTQRGVKHIYELIDSIKEGYHAYLFFVIQMQRAVSLEPNIATHPEFAEALCASAKSGVKLLAYTCNVSTNSMTIDAPVPIKLPAKK